MFICHPYTAKEVSRNNEVAINILKANLVYLERVREPVAEKATRDIIRALQAVPALRTF